jgi:hypothetical protein
MSGELVQPKGFPKLASRALYSFFTSVFRNFRNYRRRTLSSLSGEKSSDKYDIPPLINSAFVI